MAAGRLPDVSWPGPRGSWPEDSLTQMWPHLPCGKEEYAQALSSLSELQGEVPAGPPEDAGTFRWLVGEGSRESGIARTHTDPALGTGPGFTSNSPQDSRHGFSQSGPQFACL